MTPQSPVIRQASQADIPAVLAIERASETAPHWSEAEYLKIVRGEGPVARCFFVAERVEIVGFAVGMVADGAGELESVAVDLAARRQGVGRELCRAVLAWCRVRGATVVDLEVRAASVGPRRLYAELGFIEMGLRRGYYEAPPDDAVAMRLPCASRYPGDV
jgi:ribosomal protein S18 acetylase RimI-like enzyme